MNWIEKMIAEQCPNGVERVKLGEVARLVRGKVISKMYVAEHAGEYPVYSSQTANNGVFGKIDSYMFDGDYLTWTTDGVYAGTVFRRKGKFNITNICGLIDIKSKDINIDFLFYWLSITTSKYVNKGIDNPKLMSNVVELIEIPLPPLSIQEEIVSVLDNFSELIEKTDEEIALRQKQYEYYREKLLTFEDGEVKWKKLGNVFSIKKGTYITKKESNPGIYPVVLGGQEPGYYIDKYNHEGDVIVVSRSGVNAGYVSFWKEPIFVSDGFYIESAENNLRFLYSFLKLKQNEINEMKRGAGVPHITTGHLENISIPIPSLSRQQEIVATLDKFEALISKLKEERELRQKQYEYYREKLLTF